MNDELLTRAKVHDLDREALRLQRLREARPDSTRKDHDGTDPPSMTPRTPLALLKELRLTL
jgi:hypothetical protein